MPISKKEIYLNLSYDMISCFNVDLEIHFEREAMNIERLLEDREIIMTIEFSHLQCLASKKHNVLLCVD